MTTRSLVGKTISKAETVTDYTCDFRITFEDGGKLEFTTCGPEVEGLTIELDGAALQEGNCYWEYAGFRYEIWRDDNGVCKAIPVEGQHSAAGKEKHRRAALETWEAERKKRDDVS